MATVYAAATKRPVEEIRSEMAVETMDDGRGCCREGLRRRPRRGQRRRTRPLPIPRLRQGSPAPRRDGRCARLEQASAPPLRDGNRRGSDHGTKETPMPSSNETAPGVPAATQPSAATGAAKRPRLRPRPVRMSPTSTRTRRGRADALAYMREVQDLCALAGKPELASAFIEKGAKAADIRRELIDARASASAPPPSPRRHLAGFGAATAPGSPPLSPSA